MDPLDKIAEIAGTIPTWRGSCACNTPLACACREASLLNPARDPLEPDCFAGGGRHQGGRPRAVPIETEAQRALLREAEEQVRRTGHSMIPPQYDLKQWLTRCYTVLARHGVTARMAWSPRPAPSVRQRPLRRTHRRTQSGTGARRSMPATIRPPARNSPPVWVMPALDHPRLLRPGIGRWRPPPRSADEVKQQARELSVQKRLLAARLKDRIGATTRRGLDAVSASTRCAHAC